MGIGQANGPQLDERGRFGDRSVQESTEIGRLSQDPETAPCPRSGVQRSDWWIGRAQSDGMADAIAEAVRAGVTDGVATIAA